MNDGVHARVAVLLVDDLRARLLDHDLVQDVVGRHVQHLALAVQQQPLGDQREQSLLLHHLRLPPAMFAKLKYNDVRQ